MRHTIVISDIHLCETERSDGLWMRYRQEAYSPDREIARMLAEARRLVRGEELCLVLNGDVFDLDAPRVIKGETVFHDLPRTAANAVEMLRAILDDHPRFVEAVGAVLAEGHEVVFLSGNHDVQLTLPEVRTLVTERIVAAAVAASPPDGALGATAYRERLAFRSWFHKTADGIVIEHGNQYDPFCSFRYPMAPFGRDPRTIQPTLGSLAARNLMSRMGYFNPHVERSFMLSLVGYLTHWARYYLFSRRSLAVAWAVGAVRTLATLLRVREPASRARRRENRVAAALETGVPAKTVARHARLFALPAEDRIDLVLRELWLDRAALSVFCLLFGLVWIALTKGALLAGAALAPMFLVGYELLVPKIPLDATWDALEKIGRKIAKTHRASAVVFGHTHRARGTWEKGIFYGNTGSWSAAYRDIECTQPLDADRPVVWLRSTPNRRRIEGGLARWKDGTFTPDSAATVAVELSPLSSAA